MRSLSKPALFALVLTIAVAVIAGIARAAGYRPAPAVVVAGITHTVIDADSLAPAEVAFILNGKLLVRSRAAAYLYANGYARRFVVAPTDDERRLGPHAPSFSSSDMLVQMLEDNGVPRSVVKVLPRTNPVHNTRDEIRALRGYLERNPASSITIVTTDYHTGRTRLLIEQELGGVPTRFRIAGARDISGINPSNWWRSREGVRTYAGEFLKMLGTRAGL
jgi:uncharacterized SAM-binding protein YcdF (DUF218 family)